jgi:uncharacterized SAM-binding protein YcdF (DUF218 family)
VKLIIFLSKFLPLFLYPTGLITLLIILTLLVWKRPKLAKTFLIIAFLTLFVAGNKYFAFSFVKSLEWQYPPLTSPQLSDAIVVLGGGTEPLLTPRTMVEVNAASDRVLYAVQLYKAGVAPVILLSGGDIDFLDQSNTSPAEDMAELMVLTGVPQSDLILQGKSQNTQEDAIFSCQLIKENKYQSVILVTSALHMPRSVALFESQGCEVTPAPTDYTITDEAWDRLWHPSIEEFFINLMPAYTNISMVTKTMKEYFGLLYYNLRGLI